MKSLRQQLLNDFESTRGLATKMAKTAGYSTAAKLKQMLEKSNGEVQNFDGFIKAVHEYYPDNYLELLSCFTDEISPCKTTARNLLEFLSLNRQFEGVKNLIKKMKERECPNTEWAKAYEILLDYQQNVSTIDYDEMLIRVRKLKTNNFELCIFLNILRTYSYHQMGRYNKVADLADEIEFDLKDANTNYLIETFKIRHAETMSYLTLRLNNQPVKAREYADKVINSKIYIGEAFNAYAYFIKGYSYIFNSYEQAKKYLTISRDIYAKLNRSEISKDLDEKIEFVEVLWGKDINCNYFKNSVLKNIELYDDLSNEVKTKIEEPFLLYLEGKRHKDTNILLNSVISYLNKGDFFLANLPKEELLKNGFDKNVLENLLSIRVA